MISDEMRRRGHAARAERIASTRRTTLRGSESCPWRVGEPVRVASFDEEAVHGGTWHRFRGRSGWVASINRQVFPSGRTYVEVGVSWDRPKNMTKASADAWFRVDELHTAFV